MPTHVLEDELRIACLYVDYRVSGAVAADLWFSGWSATTAEVETVASFATVAEYEPGAFYRRELPCLLGVLARGPRADVIVVDGYVWIAGGATGLGAHLQAAVGGVVVRVAKTRYVSASGVVLVYRGASRSPLFVSAVGVDVETAAGWVGGMHGAYRVPTLLKRVDTLARAGTLDAQPSVVAYPNWRIGSAKCHEPSSAGLLN